MHSTGILTIGSKFIVVFEMIFFRNQKKCYVPENFDEREVIPQSRPSQQTPSPDFSSEFLCLVAAIAINLFFAFCGYLLVVCNFARFHGIWLRNKVARARTRVMNEFPRGPTATPILVTSSSIQKWLWPGLILLAATLDCDCYFT